MGENPGKSDGLPLRHKVQRALTGKEPVAFRGLSGIPFFRDARPREEQLAELERIEKAANRHLATLDRHDPKARLDREQARLIIYFSHRLGRREETANFSLTLKEAQGWTKSSSEGRRKSQMAENASDAADDNITWAAGVRDLIQSLGFVLKARMPKGATYFPDGWRGHTGAVMARPREADISGYNLVSLVEKVRYLGTWGSFGRPGIQRIVLPLLLFQDIITRDLLQLTPETTLASVVDLFQRAYRDSNLATAVAEHRAVRDRMNRKVNRDIVENSDG